MSVKGKKKYILFPASAVLLLIAALVLVGRDSTAWFSLHRSISTPSAIAMPAVLDIRGKDNSEIESISLNELSTAEDGSAQFLFCVCGDTPTCYVIELAHTTNVPFRYQIFPARAAAVAPDPGWVEYAAEETDEVYFYHADSELAMTYLNEDPAAPAGSVVARGRGDGYYQKVYSDTDSVHSAAMPLFKLSDTVQSDPSAPQQFVDYYVLQVSWDESQQSKEVDMVYLLVQVAHT